MRTFVLLLLVAVVVGLVIYRRRQSSNTQEAMPDEPRRLTATTKFHAVSIHYPSGACAAVKALAGERYLSTEAPPLPLPDCTHAKCECRFVHHPDRRSGKDRRSPFASGGIPSGTGKFDAERRDGADRRRDASRDASENGP